MDRLLRQIEQHESQRTLIRKNPEAEDNLTCGALFVYDLLRLIT